MSRILHRRMHLAWAALALSAGLQMGSAGEFEAKFKDQRVVVWVKGRAEPYPGKFIREDEEVIWLYYRSATFTIKKASIERMEPQKPPEEEFRERLKGCKTADDLVKLAVWCADSEVNLPERRKECLGKAIELEKDHKRAHEELGQEVYEGKWVSFEEYSLKAKKIRVNGKWLTVEQAYDPGRAKMQKEYEGVHWTLAKRLPSAHYELVCNSTKEVGEHYLEVLEALNKEYSRLLEKYPQAYSGKSVVYVFRNVDEYLDFTLMDPHVGGYFNPADRAVRAYHGFFGFNRTEEVLAHEATHQFQHRILLKRWPVVPMWVKEGMAVYFGEGARLIYPNGDRRKKPERVEVGIPSSRLQSLKLAIRSKAFYLPLPLLLLGDFEGRHREYDHGWGLIFWCLEGDRHGNFVKRGAGEAVWATYFKHLTEEAPLPRDERELIDQLKNEAQMFVDLLQKETGLDWTEWEKQYQKFILALPLEHLGEWQKGGNSWDGSKELAIRITFPAKAVRVAEEDLRMHAQEVAAAQSAQGVRFSLAVTPNLEDGLHEEEILRRFVQGGFQDVIYDGDGKEDPSIVEPQPGLRYAVIEFEGLYNQQIESLFGRRDAPATGTPAPGAAPKGKAKAVNPAIPFNPAARNRFRIVLHANAEKVYLISMAGPRGALSESSAAFEAMLKSIKRGYGK